ncbi:DnaJ domain-containing protein [Lichenibacterium dinghuense]|uniref:DnaJ domain-containing protein n=1 Tax=Lichenibacterium dinghuense TaxID=2895977 RepID=UPI001F466D2D|nr:DnaJ domain-containing protein [Lichenibacterium sp. 6Y81]
MIPLVAGVVLFWMGSLLVREFLRASPAAVARRMKQGGGAVLVVFALLMLVRGQVGLALGFGGLGFWLMTGRRASVWGAARAVRGAPRPGRTKRGRVSRVRSATIEMELDHVSGVMSGIVLAGPFEGAPLAQLDRDSLASLHDFCLSADVEGARLLEAYFDRRFPGWRGASQDKADAGRGGANAGAGPGARRGMRSGAMSEDEAYQLLGLAKGASREEVARAHRSVMKKAHPDHGGSTDLAARVNEAKDVLMRRHQ